MRRRSNNEDDGASCDPNDLSVESAVCSDNPNQCESCFNLYDKCSRIPVSFCTDFRYAAKVGIIKTSKLFLIDYFSLKDSVISIVVVIPAQEDEDQQMIMN